MNFYLTDSNRVDAIKDVITHIGCIKIKAEIEVRILDMCNKWIVSGNLSEKQEAAIARYWFIKVRQPILVV
jgi:hypothetical protein